MLAVAQAGRLSDRGRRHHIGGRSRNSLISTRSVVLQPRGRHRRVAVNASGDDAKDQEQKTEATPEQAPPKEENAFAQFVADAFASPLLYITLGAAVAVKVVSSSEQVGTVVALSAFPIVGLTALSKTGVGQKLQSDLQRRMGELQSKAESSVGEQAAARAVSPYYGTRRPTILQPPAHLTGELPGDYGFDPLGLAADGRLARMFELEILHARWAMLAVPGCLLPEMLSLGGIDIGETVWWKVGAAKLSGDTINYLGIEGLRVAGKQGIGVIAACQLVLMGGPEYARSVGIKGLEPVGIFLPGDANYPGGAPFDPFGYGENAAELEEQKVKEIKNGRLAMLAMLAFAVQAAVTGAGPVENVRQALAIAS